MAHELSILRSAQRAAVRVKPYPHLVLRDALAERHYRELVASYPADAVIVEHDRGRAEALREIEPNARYQIPAEVALEKKLLPPC